MAVIKHYSLYFRTKDDETEYIPTWDGPVPNKERIGSLLRQIEFCHKRGIAPIVTVFAPKDSRGKET